MRVVVTGAAGQLGAALVEEFRQSHETVALTRRELDVADDAAVAATMDRLQPDVIVNCVAYNFVDLAEDHPIDALSANAFAVRALASAAQRRGAALVHYSTGFVFDGTAMLPCCGSRSARPQSVCTSSKLLGEWFALDVPRGYVLRVESLFGRAAPAGSRRAVSRSSTRRYWRADRRPCSSTARSRRPM
jgi:dTDP-4-dehydrorhamnose reductase